MFCPPRAVKLPPTNTSVASRYARASSPMVSSTITGRPAARRSAAGLDTARLGQRLHPRRAIDVARRDHQPQVGDAARAAAATPPAAAPPRPRACSRPSAPARPAGGPAPCAAPRPPPRARACQRVELGVAGDPDPVQRRAERQRALGLLVLAHEQQIELPPAGCRTGRRACGSRAGDAGERRPLVSATRAPEARAAWMRFGQSSAYSSTRRSGRSARIARRVLPARSHGRVHQPVHLGAEPLLRHRPTGVGDGRQDDARVREPLAEPGDHRRERLEVPGARSVQPDPGPAALGERPRTVEAEALAPPRAASSGQAGAAGRAG